MQIIENIPVELLSDHPTPGIERRRFVLVLPKALHKYEIVEEYYFNKNKPNPYGLPEQGFAPTAKLDI